MRLFATQKNPDYMRAQEQLFGLRNELALLQKRHGLSDDGNPILPSANLPAAGLEYVRKLRDVRYHETLFDLLARQFEMAKIDEAKDAGLVQTIDRAVPPDEKAKPKRLLIVALAGIGFFFIAVLLAFAHELVDRLKVDPLHSNRIAILSAALSSRRRKARAS
jgi:hypothetical protein